MKKRPSKKPAKKKTVKRIKKKLRDHKPSSIQQKFLQEVPGGYRPPATMVNPDQQHVQVIKRRFIERWLLRSWMITSQIAWRNFGHTRLADVVWKMRMAGFKITTTMVEGIDRFGNKVHYAEYRINKKRSARAIKRYNKAYGKK